MKPTATIVADMLNKGYSPEKVERVQALLEKVDRTLGTEPLWPFNGPAFGDDA